MVGRGQFAEPSLQPHVSLAGSGLLSGEEKENLFTSCEEKGSKQKWEDKGKRIQANYILSLPVTNVFLSAD